MNAITTLERVRDLTQSKLTQLQPLAGEEMTLPSMDPERDGFVEGERALAAQILRLIDGPPDHSETFGHAEPLEEEMVLSLGRT